MGRGVVDEETKLVLSLIIEEIEFYDELLYKRKDICKEWYIVRQGKTTLSTGLGDIIYKNILFKTKKHLLTAIYWMI